MKHKSFISLLFLWLAIAVGAQPKHEIRAVWLTTIGGIDWPSTPASDSKSIESQQQELCQILDKLKAINVNTILFHTRVRATTSYPSDIEPWYESYSGYPGVSPGYDVLQYVIDEGHRRGMEVHAWVVTLPIGKWNAIGCRELRKRYPKIVRRIGEDGFMNPEQPQTAEYLADICDEIVRKYDVDGIHLDYIRYPETWPLAKNAHERTLRREHITYIVQCIHDRVKSLKPWLKLSCSPIGKFDDLSRYRSFGWNAYSRVGQDAQGWLRNGLMDQLYPMMYFSGNQFFPFAIDWQEQSTDRSIVAGLGIYMLHPNENNWPLSEVKRQLNVSRSLGLGHSYFRSKFVLSNIKGVYDYLLEFDRHPALIPPMTWQHSIPPSPPSRLEVSRTSTGDNLSWSGAHDNSDGDYLLYNIYASTEDPVDITRAENLIAVRHLQTEISIVRQPGKPQLHYAVTAMDRYGNESTPVRLQTNDSHPVSVPTRLLDNDGLWLSVPRQQMDADRLIVETLQGGKVRTFMYQEEINISYLPEGCYVLRSCNKKGVTHRLGHFFIKRNKDS